MGIESMSKTSPLDVFRASWNGVDVPDESPEAHASYQNFTVAPVDSSTAVQRRMLERRERFKDDPLFISQLQVNYGDRINVQDLAIGCIQSFMEWRRRARRVSKPSTPCEQISSCWR
jgi:hypothetical protein